MDQEKIRSSLIAGGVGVDELEESASNDVSTFSALLDPRGADALVRQLAEQLGEYHPSRIVVWEDLENSVLAYIVARELGVAAVRVVDASGVLDYDGTFTRGDRVAIVADAIRSPQPLNAIRSLSEQHGAQVVVIGVLLATPALDEAAGQVPVVTLWSPGLDASSP